MSAKGGPDRRGFAIRLKRLSLEPAILGGSKLLEGRTISSIFVSNYIDAVFLFWFKERRFFHYVSRTDLYRRMSSMDWSVWRWALCLWRWKLVIVTYNVWDKTFESIFQIARGRRGTFVPEQVFSVWASSVWAVSVWAASVTGHLCLAVSITGHLCLAVSVTGHMCLTVSVTGYFGRDISAHKELITFVYWNYYIGRRNVTLASVIPTPWTSAGGAKRAFALPLEIGTKKEKFLENVKSAVQFLSVGLILAVTVFADMTLTLHKSQVHCFANMQLWACRSLNSLLCLQRQVAKLARDLFYHWPLLRNNNMGSNLRRCTSSHWRKRFAACNFRTQTSW